MTTIPDFTEAEHKQVSTLLFERYGKLVPIPRCSLCAQPFTGTNAAHISSREKLRLT
jgi:hypothetical protein